MVDDSLIHFEKVTYVCDLIYCIYNCSLDMLISYRKKLNSLNSVIHRFHNNSAEDF